MKKFLIATVFVLLNPALASADSRSVELVNGDGSELSALCIAAAQSSSPVSGLDLNPLERRELLCNGKPLERFVLQIHEKRKMYVFEVSDGSELSKLCLAAIVSDTHYKQVREELFGNAHDLENSVRCNDMPIKAFARKYRNQNLTAAL